MSRRNFSLNSALAKCILATVLFVAISGCQTTSGTSSLSAIEKRQVEQRLYDYPIEIIYPSVLAVLIDQGFSIQNSDKAGGLIVAEKFGERRQWGLVAYDRDKFTASIIIAPAAASVTSVRYTIRKMIMSNLGYGEGVKDVEEVLDPDVSAAFFSLLRAEAEKRKVGVGS